MITRYRRSFEKDLETILDSSVLKRIETTIQAVKSANRLLDIPNIKKLAGHKYAYRIKIAEYRLGFFLINNEVEFIRILDRKDIYKYFP